MNHHPIESLSETLGVPFYRPGWHLPSYRVTATSRWRLIEAPFHLEPGYWSGLWGVAGLPVLMRATAAGDWETWMSISPHELESQELPCRHAGGHVVVMGLGMGWIALNLALRPGVRRVTVVERDPEVLDLFQNCGAMDDLTPGAATKVDLVLGDALEYVPMLPVDLLYADIWRDLDEPQTLEQVRIMQSHVQARQVSFWGQEIALARHLGGPLAGISDEVLRARAEETLGLPLLIPDDSAYGRQVDAVIRQRETRGLLPVPIRSNATALC